MVESVPAWAIAALRGPMHVAGSATGVVDATSRIAADAARTIDADPWYAARTASLAQARATASSPAIASTVDELALALAAARAPGGLRAPAGTATHDALGVLAAQQRRLATLDLRQPGAPSSNLVWKSLQVIRDATITAAVDALAREPAASIDDVERLASGSRTSTALADALESAMLATAPGSAAGAGGATDAARGSAAIDLDRLASDLRASADLDGTRATPTAQVVDAVARLRQLLRTTWTATAPTGDPMVDAIAADARREAGIAMVPIRRGLDRHAASGWLPMADFPDQGAVGRLASSLEVLGAARAEADGLAATTL